MRKLNKTKLTVYLPPDLHVLILAAADKAGQSITVWVERACQARLSGGNDAQAN